VVGKSSSLYSLPRLRENDMGDPTPPIRLSITMPKPTRTSKKNAEDGKRPLLDQSIVNQLYEIAVEATQDEFISSFIDTRNVLNFFYTKYIMLPTMLHVKFTDTGLSNKMHDKDSEMIRMYEELIDLVKDANSRKVEEIKKKIRDLTTTTSEKKYQGTPSHLKIANGKEGIYRDFAQNPRAWGTTRAVLTDGAERSGVIQCPINIMRNQYYTYVVSSHNKEWLQHKVIKGVVTHMAIARESSSTVRGNDYVTLSSKSVIKIGDVVIKQVETGDKIIMNRHPTLWKHSMLGYRVDLWDVPCFGLNETNTKGLNADYDGDEGNAQIPHSTTGRIEASMLQAQYNLFGSHNGDPVVTILYNGIIGMYELSRDPEISESLFNRLLDVIRAKRFREQSAYIRDLELTEADLVYYEKKASKHGKNYRSGATLISMLFPKGLCYKRDKVVIEDGFLVSGDLKSKDISYEIIKAISLIDRFAAPYRVVDVGYTLASEYISAKGMMISANDYLAPGPTGYASQESDMMMIDQRGPYALKIDQVRKAQDPKFVRRENVASRQFWKNLTKEDRRILYDRSSIMPDDFAEKLSELNIRIIEFEEIKAGQTQASAERTEQVIASEISDFTAEYEKLLKKSSYEQRNISKISFMSGARGNIGQVMAAVSFVGQQYADADRLGLNVSRLSYYSQPGSKSIYDKGFVKNSFADGLSPHEVMMLAGPARRAAFKTYLGTPESGHISRQTILHTCGMKVNNHFATEDRSGIFIETLYGYGCDSAYVSKRSSVFGKTESVADPVALLKYLNAKRAA
jgi:DNA-directed RNA polymerase beta' subunit